MERGSGQTRSSHYRGMRFYVFEHCSRGVGDGIYGAPECTRRSALSLWVCLPVEGTEVVDVDVSGVAGGIVLALAEVSMSRAAPAAASGSGEAAESLRLSTAGWWAGWEDGRTEI